MKQPHKEITPSAVSTSGHGNIANKRLRKPQPNKWQSRNTRPDVTQWQTAKHDEQPWTIDDQSK